MSFFIDFAVFFKTIDSLLWQGTVRYDRVRYGTLENSDKYGLPTVFTTLNPFFYTYWARLGKNKQTVRDFDRSETFMLYMMNGPERWQNSIHGTFMFTFQKWKINCSFTNILFLKFVKYFFMRIHTHTKVWINVFKKYFRAYLFPC